MPKIKVNGRINKVNGNNDVRLRVVNKEEHRTKGGNALAVSTNSLAPQAELEPAGQRTRGFDVPKMHEVRGPRDSCVTVRAAQPR